MLVILGKPRALKTQVNCTHASNELFEVKMSTPNWSTSLLFKFLIDLVEITNQNPGMRTISNSTFQLIP